MMALCICAIYKNSVASGQMWCSIMAPVARYRVQSFTTLHRMTTLADLSACIAISARATDSRWDILRMMRAYVQRGMAATLADLFRWSISIATVASTPPCRMAESKKFYYKPKLVIRSYCGFYRPSLPASVFPQHGNSRKICASKISKSIQTLMTELG